MKIMIDGVFYNDEMIDFKKIMKNLVKELGDAVIVRSLELPEIGAIYEDSYYYRCGFTLDKEITEKMDKEELDKLKEKIISLFPENTSVYSLICEIYE
ncbi:conserved hypothetical protein [Methanococcus aeolicus Nankai-3]|uniref:Uncharacterized protein n=1 Tax=Methanococcus aeolicus (strain ATCC BAA-1280 / DSM 17508 / OCM 812 / Nankai-3) TaxID=419665 RepID=A6UUB1_META3|nr:hypothetical protein [Methanococcus aeolicus]ABR56083.1 conserved hypothetical protein [Methanococcus aeolicus Nankai-3]